MHGLPKAMQKIRRQRRRSRIAKRFLTLVAPMLLGPIAGSVSQSKARSAPVHDVQQVSLAAWQEVDFETNLQSLYAELAPEAIGLRYDVFHEAMVGYLNLRRAGELDPARKLLTIVDFEQSSTQKRLYVLDLDQKKVVFNTLVAHGQGSGEDLANRFSNEPDSHMSSLGFFVTGDTYQGCHGLSLYLNGKDEGYNTNAYNRSVVMHGAPYVSEDFIRQNGRLGRSHGCPALPPELTEPIVNTLKGGTCLFLYSPKERYESKFLDQQVARQAFYSEGVHI
jgi:L,D-transpeptidase catalytic domain